MKKNVLLLLCLISSLSAFSTFLLNDERDAYFAFIEENEDMLNKKSVHLLPDGKIMILSKVRVETKEVFVNSQRVVEYIFIRDSLATILPLMPEKDLLSLSSEQILTAYEGGKCLLNNYFFTQTDKSGFFTTGFTRNSVLTYNNQSEALYLEPELSGLNSGFNGMVISYTLIAIALLGFVVFQVRNYLNQKGISRLNLPLLNHTVLFLLAAFFFDFLVAVLSGSYKLSLIYYLFLSGYAYQVFFGETYSFMEIFMFRAFYITILLIGVLALNYVLDIYYRTKGKYPACCNLSIPVFLVCVTCWMYLLLLPIILFFNFWFWLFLAGIVVFFYFVIKLFLKFKEFKEGFRLLLL